tara:strand:- start:271 stop:441 length:171 start_codon:yes stop_codon:yes gene_type:complete
MSTKIKRGGKILSIIPTSEIQKRVDGILKAFNDKRTKGLGKSYQKMKNELTKRGAR